MPCDVLTGAQVTQTSLHSMHKGRAKDADAAQLTWYKTAVADGAGCSPAKSSTACMEPLGIHEHVSRHAGPTMLRRRT